MWMAAASIKDPTTKMIQLKKVLSFCPPANQNLIRYLAKFLKEFSIHSDKTKMTATNLSICFAPNLLRAPDNIGLADQIEESPIATSLLVLFIEQYDTFFETISSSGSLGAAATAAAAPKPSLTSSFPPGASSSSSSSSTSLSSANHPPDVSMKKPAPKFIAAKPSTSTQSTSLGSRDSADKAGRRSTPYSMASNSSGGDILANGAPVVSARTSSPVLTSSTSERTSAAITSSSPQQPPVIPPKPNLQDSTGKSKSYHNELSTTQHTSTTSTSSTSSEQQNTTKKAPPQRPTSSAPVFH